MLLFEERTMDDEKKAQRKNIKAYAVREKLDIKLFNTNVKTYHVKHPETKEPCVLCVLDGFGEMLDGFGEMMVKRLLDKDRKFDGIDVHILHPISDKNTIQEFLNDSNLS